MADAGEYRAAGAHLRGEARVAGCCVASGTELLTYAKVMENILFPWQFRSLDARPQEFLGMLESFNFPIKKMLKMFDIFRHTVSHGAFEAIPDEFIRIDLGSISREVIRENAIVESKKLFNRSRLVDSTGIPEKNESSFEMPEKVLKEGQNLRISDILRPVKTDIKTDSSFLGRNADSGDSRDLCPPSVNFKNRGLAARRPSFSNRWDKTKPAFVEKNQGNPERFRLFLYAAKYDVSTVLSSPRPVLWPLSRVSGSSSPVVSKTTRDGLDDTIPRSVFGSPRRFCGLSKDRWSSLPLEVLPKESLSTTVSDAVSSLPGAPGPVSISSLQNLSLETLSAIGGQNLPKSRFSQQQPADLILDSTTRQRAGASVRDAFGFHMVSWNNDSIFRDILPLLLRYSIVCRT